MKIQRKQYEGNNLLGYKSNQNGVDPYCEFTTSSATDTAWVAASHETFVPVVHHSNYSVEKYLECLGHTLRSALIGPAISAARRSAK